MIDTVGVAPMRAPDPSPSMELDNATQSMRNMLTRGQVRAVRRRTYDRTIESG